MNTLLDVEIPRSTQCPHYSNGQFIEGHEYAPMRRRKGDTVQRWKCKICKREIRWDSDYHMYVLPYLIEEVPW
ncbi:MAG TPA: hypothetical protein VFH56_02890 [Acidimicrobiales bacterium]|nr:hypothetical protein [Acidimicrobiales bacterium]